MSRFQYRFPFTFQVSLIAVLLCAVQARPQKPTPAGDTPAEAGPLATDLSPALKKDAIAKAMHRVGDWQLEKSRDVFNQDWTFAALYRGYIAAAESLHDNEYRDAMMEVGKKFDWKLGSRVTHADDHALGYVYLKLYEQTHDAKMLAATKETLDHVMTLPDVCTESCPPWHDATTPMWWWCDALFMAPPVLADLAKITGQRQYLEFMDRQWEITSNLLYDPQVHLFYRDATFLGKHQANGQGLFWSRGNGWVMAGLVRILDAMPDDYPSRQKYISQLRAMATEIASLQGNDGLWRPGLLDPGAYRLPENSGSAFYVYALAYGVNHGILERARYLPVIEKAWAALVAHIYADGRLGCVQPIGAAPGDYPATASYVFGTGAFLLAGSEVDRLAR